MNLIILTQTWIFKRRNPESSLNAKKLNDEVVRRIPKIFNFEYVDYNKKDPNKYNKIYTVILD